MDSSMHSVRTLPSGMHHCAAAHATSARRWLGAVLAAEYGPDPSEMGAISAEHAAALGHAGTWRDQLGAYFCSRPEFPDGPHCQHFRVRGKGRATGDEGVIESPHWGCCGSTSWSARCKLPPKLAKAKAAQAAADAAALAAADGAGAAAAGATGGAGVARATPAGSPAATAAAGTSRHSTASWTATVGALVSLADGVSVDGCLPSASSVGEVVSVASDAASGLVTVDVSGPAGGFATYKAHQLKPHTPAGSGMPAAAAFEAMLSLLQAGPTPQRGVE